MLGRHLAQGSGVGGQSAADLISLPQGGGAVRGLGETFSPDITTTTAETVRATAGGTEFVYSGEFGS
jgi:hypothetical protein